MTDATTSRAARPRARRGEGEALRDEILAAARRLLAERGDEALVSIRAVADAVGVTPPSIYLHFSDKDTLIVEVCERLFRDFDADQESAGAAHADPLESLKARGRAYVAFGLSNPEAYRVLFMTRSTRTVDLDDPAEASPAGVAALRHFVDAVGRCVDAGAFAPQDPMLIALQLWTGIHGVVSLMICEPGFPWPRADQLVDSVLATLARGLAPERS